MTPRHERLSPQESMDELSAGSSSSLSSNISSSSVHEQQQQQQQRQRTLMVGSLTKPLIIHHSSEETCLTKTTTTTRTRRLSKDEEDEDAASPDPNALLFEPARLKHDYFNLVALLFVIASAAIDWDITLVFHGLGSLAYKGNYFWLTWGTVFLYFLIDLMWVTRVPQCVKSPRTIVQHHLVVLCYMCAPIFWPEYRWFMGALLSVEINTWFLILRRVVYKKNIVMLSDAVSFSFYLSWIVIRCGIYPAILIHFLYLAKLAIQESGRLWHWPMIFIPVHFVLCCLNLKWSWDLFYPIVKSWFARTEDAASLKARPPGVVSSGL